MNKWDNISIALAGIFQATGLVEQLAKTGQVQNDAYRTSIESLLVMNPANTLDVYGGSAANLRQGLEGLRSILQNGQNAKSDALRYSLGVLHLQKKLSADNAMLKRVATRLQQAAQQAEHFSSTHDNVIANIGGLYTDTISTFRFRIQVSGNYNYLQQQRIAHQVRALLFAAIRSAILWRQVGGNRWQLLLGRKKILSSVDNLLRTLPA